MKHLLLSIAFCLSSSSGVWAQANKEIKLKAPISEVTVYLKGAQVYRSVSTSVAAGKSTLKFSNLSPYIDAKSIQARVHSSKVTVLSVNHQLNYLDSIKRNADNKRLEEQLEAAKEKLSIEKTKLEVINEDLNFLKENIRIGGSNEGVTLLKLKETAAFYSQQVNSLKTRKLETDKNIAKLTKTINEISRQLGQQGESKSEPTGEVLIEIEAATPTTCEVSLSYYTDNAGWHPSYDIRSAGLDKPIRLAYKANIRQNTKEDWKDVKLKVSSMNPGMGSTAPELRTYFLGYHLLPPRYDTNFSSQIEGRVSDASGEALIGASVRIAGSSVGTVTDNEGRFSLARPSSDRMLEISYIGMQTQNIRPTGNFLNIVMQENPQSLEERIVVGYGVKRKSLRSMAKANAVALEEDALEESAPLPVVQQESPTGVEFEIKIPYSIQSDNKSIAVDVDSYQLPASYEYFCIPKADPDAFLLAYVRDWEKYNLLEGEANIFYENSFVGKTILDTRRLSDTLNISLGRDKNVQVKREKMKNFSSKQFLGNKQESTRLWKISLRNNKKQSIRLMLFDQIPVSTMQEIEVSPDKLSGGKLDKENGRVSWTLELPAGAKEELELQYSVKYPKGRHLTLE